MEAEYIVASEAAKEAVWLKNVLSDLEVIPRLEKLVTFYYDNIGAVKNSKKPRSYKRWEHIERKHHLIQEIVNREDVTMTKIPTLYNLVDPFTKTLNIRVFEKHLEGLGIKNCSSLL